MQAVFLACTVALAAVSGNPVQDANRYALIIILAVAMGIQNATARRLAVPDLTTTVLTLTITGLAADSAIAGGQGSKAGRRLIAVAVMLIGAIIGAAFVVNGRIVYPLIIALVVTAVAAIASRTLAGSDSRWIHMES
ncbi:MAG: DUF1275 family protein [Candidatus Dormibacteria bacterium]